MALPQGPASYNHHKSCAKGAAACYPQNANPHACIKNNSWNARPAAPTAFGGKLSANELALLSFIRQCNTSPKDVESGASVEATTPVKAAAAPCSSSGTPAKGKGKKGLQALGCTPSSKSADEQDTALEENSQGPPPASRNDASVFDVDAAAEESVADRGDVEEEDVHASAALKEGAPACIDSTAAADASAEVRSKGSDQDATSSSCEQTTASKTPKAPALDSAGKNPSTSRVFAGPLPPGAIILEEGKLPDCPAVVVAKDRADRVDGVADQKAGVRTGRAHEQDGADDDEDAEVIVIADGRSTRTRWQELEEEDSAFSSLYPRGYSPAAASNLLSGADARGNYASSQLNFPGGSGGPPFVAAAEDLPPVIPLVPLLRKGGGKGGSAAATPVKTTLDYNSTRASGRRSSLPCARTRVPLVVSQARDGENAASSKSNSKKDNIAGSCATGARACGSQASVGEASSANVLGAAASRTDQGDKSSESSPRVTGPSGGPGSLGKEKGESCKIPPGGAKKKKKNKSKKSKSRARSAASAEDTTPQPSTSPRAPEMSPSTKGTKFAPPGTLPELGSSSSSSKNEGSSLEQARATCKGSRQGDERQTAEHLGGGREQVVERDAPSSRSGSEAPMFREGRVGAFVRSDTGGEGEDEEDPHSCDGGRTSRSGAACELQQIVNRGDASSLRAVQSSGALRPTTGASSGRRARSCMARKAGSNTRRGHLPGVTNSEFQEYPDFEPTPDADSSCSKEQRNQQNQQIDVEENCDASNSSWRSPANSVQVNPGGCSETCGAALTHFASSSSTSLAHLGKVPETSACAWEDDMYEAVVEQTSPTLDSGVDAADKLPTQEGVAAKADEDDADENGEAKQVAAADETKVSAKPTTSSEGEKDVDEVVQKLKNGRDHCSKEQAALPLAAVIELGAGDADDESDISPLQSLTHPVIDLPRNPACSDEAISIAASRSRDLEGKTREDEVQRDLLGEHSDEGDDCVPSVCSPAVSERSGGSGFATPVSATPLLTPRDVGSGPPSAKASAFGTSCEARATSTTACETPDDSGPPCSNLFAGSPRVLSRLSEILPSHEELGGEESDFGTALASNATESGLEQLDAELPGELDANDTVTSEMGGDSSGASTAIVENEQQQEKESCKVTESRTAGEKTEIFPETPQSGAEEPRRRPSSDATIPLEDSVASVFPTLTSPSLKDAAQQADGLRKKNDGLGEPIAAEACGADTSEAAAATSLKQAEDFLGNANSVETGGATEKKGEAERQPGASSSTEDLSTLPGAGKPASCSPSLWEKLETGEIMGEVPAWEPRFPFFPAMRFPALFAECRLARKAAQDHNRGLPLREQMRLYLDTAQAMFQVNVDCASEIGPLLQPIFDFKPAVGFKVMHQLEQWAAPLFRGGEILVRPAKKASDAVECDSADVDGASEFRSLCGYPEWTGAPLRSINADLRVHLEVRNQMFLRRDRALMHTATEILAEKGVDAFHEFSETRLGMQGFRCMQVLLRCGLCIKSDPDVVNILKAQRDLDKHATQKGASAEDVCESTLLHALEPLWRSEESEAESLHTGQHIDETQEEQKRTKSACKNALSSATGVPEATARDHEFRTSTNADEVKKYKDVPAASRTRSSADDDPLQFVASKKCSKPSKTPPRFFVTQPQLLEVQACIFGKVALPTPDYLFLRAINIRTSSSSSREDTAGGCSASCTTTSRNSSHAYTGTGCCSNTEGSNYAGSNTGSTPILWIDSKAENVTPGIALPQILSRLDAQFENYVRCFGAGIVLWGNGFTANWTSRMRHVYHAKLNASSSSCTSTTETLHKDSTSITSCSIGGFGVYCGQKDKPRTTSTCVAGQAVPDMAFRDDGADGEVGQNRGTEVELSSSGRSSLDNSIGRAAESRKNSKKDGESE
ncbi:unnamed protein product [Amoebophrya sp. A25]|nr:unnamed protein product [Amoebophrya sp. A25]|eukprot:GSA25T00011632001.1